MSSSQIDCLNSVFLPSQSPFIDCQETVISNFSVGISNIDTSEPDTIWTNDDKHNLILEDTPWSSPPERTNLLSFTNRMTSDVPKSKPVDIKTTPYIFKDKDDNLWDEKLPDTLLVSPRKENTPEPIPNDYTLCNLDDDKPNLKLVFPELFGDVQDEELEVGNVTKEDVALLDKLIDNIDLRELVQAQDLFPNETKNQLVTSNSGSFNEISCNINQDAAADSQSAIKTLLKNQSFQGNFAMKKSTEILSQIDRTHYCITEHSYCSSKPVSSTESSVPSTQVVQPVSVECILQDCKVEPEISSPPVGSLNLKIPQIVLPQCSGSPSSCKSISPSSSQSTPSGKQIKSGKNRRTPVKKSKKTMHSKSTTNKCSMMLKDDPTYEPSSRNRRSSGKKSKEPKTKGDCIPAFTPVTRSPECKVAKTPEMLPEPSFSCDPKSSQCIDGFKPRERSPVAAPTIPQSIGVVDKCDESDQRQPVVESTPVVRSNPSTPLASPTREDLTDNYDELKTQDSRQPETQYSNVDSTIVEPVQPSVEEAAPKQAKKKIISVQEYLKKRGPKSEADSESCNSMADIVVPAPVPNVEEILKSIVKSKSLPAIPITKVQPSPTKAPAADKPSKPAAKCESIRNTAVPNSKPIIKSQQRPHPETLKNRDDPKNRPAQKHDPMHHKSNPKPRSHPTTESKPSSIKPETTTKFKLTKIDIPARSAPARARSNSLSPNEASQSSDSCDRCSSSGVSSYQNSSMSSACVSPVDEKSNDTKCSDNGRIAEKPIPVLEMPFAVNKELLRKDDRSSKKYKRRRDKHRRSDSSSRKRKLSDSCYEDDSDCSDYSYRKRSRKRYVSSSSSVSSDRSYRHRSHTSEGSMSPRPYPNGFDWYTQQERVPEPYMYYQNFNEVPMQIPMSMPNMYYQPLPPPVSCPWPEFAPYYPAYGAPNMAVPYIFNGHHEPIVDAGEVEVDKRVLFVGNIEPDLTEEEFVRRFKKYGAIREVKLHFRDKQNNFGFVYFAEERYVDRVIKHGCDDDDLPSHYKLGRGMKKERVADRRAFVYEKPMPVSNFPTPPPPSYQEDSYNLKLEQFKSDLRQKKLNDRYK